MKRFRFEIFETLEGANIVKFSKIQKLNLNCKSGKEAKKRNFKFEILETLGGCKIVNFQK